MIMAGYMVASSMWQQPLTSMLALFFVLAAFPIHYVFIQSPKVDGGDEKDRRTREAQGDGGSAGEEARTGWPADPLDVSVGCFIGTESEGAMR